MELASNFADKAASVTCVGRSSTPFANVLGEKIGTMLKKVLGATFLKYLADFFVILLGLMNKSNTKIQDFQRCTAPCNFERKITSIKI